MVWNLTTTPPPRLHQGKRGALRFIHQRASNRVNRAEIATGYRYITRRSGVRFRNAIVEGTRIGVHDVIGLLQNGETVDSVPVTCFSELTKAQVHECRAYYEDERDEIKLLVAEQMIDLAD